MPFEFVHLHLLILTLQNQRRLTIVKIVMMITITSTYIGFKMIVDMILKHGQKKKEYLQKRHRLKKRHQVKKKNSSSVIYLMKEANGQRNRINTLNFNEID